MIIKKFLGWEEATINEYRDCYLEYGGNFSTHPDVLSYLHTHTECKEKYYIHRSSGTIDGAVCVWGDKYLANDIAMDNVTNHLGLPVAKDELILPITKERKVFVPFKGKIISPINKNIINQSIKLNARRTICLAKPLDSFSKKTAQTRNRELKKFIQEGGEVRDQSEFSPSELIDIYSTLFEIRRDKKIIGKQENIDFLTRFRENFFGKVLFYKGKPCAFQYITRCDSGNFILLDFINIGIDTHIKEFSLGTILMWLNINEVSHIQAQENKEIRFSFGRPTGDYKKRWCYQEKLGRLL